MVAHAARQRALDYMHAMVAVLLALACSPSGEKRSLSVDSAVSSTTPTGAGSSAAGASTADTAAGELPPNVLLVLLDDVGVDKVGAYGAEAAPPTPTLDALAAEGSGSRARMRTRSARRVAPHSSRDATGAARGSRITLSPSAIGPRCLRMR